MEISKNDIPNAQTIFTFKPEKLLKLKIEVLSRQVLAYTGHRHTHTQHCGSEYKIITIIILILNYDILNFEQIQIEEETDIHNIPVTEIDVNTPSTSSSLPPPSLSTPTPPSSKKRKNPEDHRLDKAFGLLTAAASAANSDEQQNFGNFVANKLKKYSARTQSAIQHAFMGIFLNADNGMYEQPLPYTYDYPSRSTTSNMSQVSNLSSNYSTPTPTPPESLQVHSPQVDDEDILNFSILH